MMKRWGQLDDSSKSFAGIPKGFTITTDDSNDDESDDDESFVSQWRRPVVDPWEKEKLQKQKTNNIQQQTTKVREYYDHDDEGFEYLEEDQDDDDEVDVYDDNDDDDDDKSYSSSSSSSSSVLNVKHLIAPKPAGGRGTSTTRTTKTLPSSAGGSYFFNPDAAANAAEKRNNNNKEKDAATQNQNNLDNRIVDSNGQKDNKRSRPSPAKPLLDDYGNLRLLTVEEALNQFQSTVDEGTMEIIETAEIPILAYSKSQSWEDLGITSEILLGNLDNMNCPTPLAVQEKTTPAILTGNDVLVGTYTGSGKTLAFLTPLVQRLLWNNNDVTNLGLAVLIVAPGRELASQIASVARELIKGTGLTVQLAIGGTTFSRNLEQIRKRKPNIVVGTPGRIAELVVGKPGEK
jgi:hypothetical protein